MAEIVTNKFSCKGITKIKIPLKDTDFEDIEKAKIYLAKYLPKVLSIHDQNRRKISYLHDFVLGQQDIDDKTRLYNKDCDNNNKVVENHAYRQTSFKTAFVTSEKRDYAHKSNSDCSDIIYLDKYFTDVNFFAKDKKVKDWVYQTGIGTTYQCVRTDIIKTIKDAKGKTTYKFKEKADGFDIETEAPFEFEVLDPRDNFVVYSSIRGENPLFCVSIVETEKDEKSTETENKIYIETRYARYITKSDISYGNIQELKLEVAKSSYDIPMVEHCSNNARIGVVELNLDLFNCINTLVSNVLDMVVDSANVIMVFKNTDITQKVIDEMRNKGALVLNDNPNSKTNSEAKMDVVKIEIPFAGLNSFYEERLTQAYDIVGVPLASGQVTSGGDTGQARLLGGGWNNAYTIVKSDITTLLESDYAVLKGLLKICKSIPNCPVKNIAASEVDIKYHINQSDNLLVKAQAISQLYSIHMPKEEILKVTGLFNDTCAVGKKWETEDQKALARENKDESGSNNNPIGFG